MGSDDDGLPRRGQELARVPQGRRPRRVRAVRQAGQGRRVHRAPHRQGARQMIANLIRWSIRNRMLVLLATVMVSAWGTWAMLRTPLDAIPDLSDVQVIIRTTYPGQAPQIVENQITYPLATTMLSVPGARTVRGYSMFGDSFVYILFEDGTDPYWARSRVLEYLNQVQSRLPPQAKTSLGPDATGVGRVYQYARVQVGPEVRRGSAELGGQGEVTGGIIVMRAGKNALETIDAVKAKLQALKSRLPAGVEMVPVYDRSGLIKRAVSNLQWKLIEEFIVVALVCLVFLFHLRSAFVAIVSLPLGVLIAFIVMYYQGVNANIMSLGGIAIAIGAMVDAAVVMIENAHKHIEAWHHAHPERKLEGAEQWRVIGDAAAQVGPALFSSLLIITLSFVPVFTLEAQEGRLFSPLAYTKSYAMAAAAGLAVTLIPVLMGYLIRGKIPDEKRNPLNRALIELYQPLLRTVLAFPKTTLAAALVILVVSAYPATHIGGEFMPPLDEGDLLYMPSALPGISAGKASELIQQTNRLIKTVPEVLSVFGKAGRAETATDPAPLEMFETTIQFKPREQWRPGMTPDKLVEELDRTVQVPGLSNIWVPPIRNRIDMLATGIKSPVGGKGAGMDLAEAYRLGL